MRASNAVLLCFFVAVFVPFVVSDCKANATSCATCLTDPGCGYCDGNDATKGCFPGTEIGPTTRTCSGGLWYYRSCFPPEDQCRLKHNCFDCVKDTSCGWCDDVCLAGNKTGPTETPMSCFKWNYNNDNCAFSCNDYTECNACKLKGCRWCNDGGGTCLPRFGQSCNDWAPTCPLVHCNTYDSCDKCIGVKGDLCVWCPTLNNNKGGCMFTENAHNDFECDPIHVGTCRDDCADRVSCDSCLQVKQCGWCDGVCTLGTKDGPTYASSCTNWLFTGASTCASVKCDKYKNCLNCTASKQCGWCGDAHSRQCSPKVENNPKCDLWFTNGCTVSSECTNQTDCRKCNDKSGCMWCEPTKGKKGCFSFGDPHVPDPKNQCLNNCPGMSGGAVALIVIGVLINIVLVFGVAYLVYHIWFRRRGYNSLDTERLIS